VTHYGHPSIHPFCAATNSCALLRTISLDGIWFFLFWFHPLFDPATCALGLIKEVELERLICLFSPVIVDWPTSIIICFDCVLRLWRTKKTKQKARMAGNTFGGVLQPFLFRLGESTIKWTRGVSHQYSLHW
jgi:hypothetical protein